MSSMYSSNTLTPRCQRCGASLALNDARCANCSFLNIPGPVSNNTQQPRQNREQQSTIAQSTSTPSSQLSPMPPQEGGLLKRFAPPNEQRNRYTPYSSFPAVPRQPAAQPPSAPLPPANPVSPEEPKQYPSVSPQPPSQPLVQLPTQTQGSEQKYTRLSGQLLSKYGNQQPTFQRPTNISDSGAPAQPIQPVQSMHPPAYTPVAPSYPSGSLQQSPIQFRASAQHRVPPVDTTRPNAISRNAGKQAKRPVGLVLGLLALALLLIGGGSLAYIYLTSRNAPQTISVGTGTSSQTTSVVTPQSTPVFQDQFTGNTNNWSLQSYPGAFAVSLGNGNLQLESDNNKLLWELLPGTQKYNNFQLSVDATLSKGSQNNGYGIYFRSALDQNSAITTFYRFELYGDGSFAVFKGLVDANGVSTTPRIVDYTNNSAIQKQGSVNHILIDAQGSELKFLVNGQIVGDIKDTTYSTGSIALFVSNLQNSPPGAVATFSHLAIYTTKS